MVILFLQYVLNPVDYNGMEKIKTYPPMLLAKNCVKFIFHDVFANQKSKIGLSTLVVRTAAVL